MAASPRVDKPQPDRVRSCVAAFDVGFLLWTDRQTGSLVEYTEE